MAFQSDNQQLTGLVLAGGRSRRMGADKGSLVYGDSAVPQVRAAWAVLEQVCGRALVSINATQLTDPVYAQLPTIVDTQADRGPAAGLLSAFEHNPNTAWLVLAVDMPRVCVNVLQNLVAQRDTDRIATVHCHADGAIEPLCAIWEMHARTLIEHELVAGRGSLRALAIEHDAAVARLPEPDRLGNVNTPDERSDMQEHLAGENTNTSEDGRRGA